MELDLLYKLILLDFFFFFLNRAKFYIPLCNTKKLWYYKARNYLFYIMTIDRLLYKLCQTQQKIMFLNKFYIFFVSQISTFQVFLVEILNVSFIFRFNKQLMLNLNPKKTYWNELWKIINRHFAICIVFTLPDVRSWMTSSVNILSADDQNKHNRANLPTRSFSLHPSHWCL